jgi:hypothetical protein
MNGLRRAATTLLAITLGFGGFAATAQNLASADNDDGNERVVHLLQEPRHRTVHRDGDLLLLDVQINPGDTSLAHTHNQAILISYISDADGSRNGEVRSIVDYVVNPLTHVVDNPGPGLFHAIALVNDSQGSAAGNDQLPSGLDIEPQVDNAWFRSYRLELAAGESTDLQLHHHATVIIQASPGLARVSRADGLIHELDRPGDWAWREAESPFQISNAGDQALILLINEGKR